MSKKMFLVVLVVGFAPVQAVFAACWECEDAAEYPWYQCATASYSDIGKTECTVQINPSGPVPGGCVFSGEICYGTQAGKPIEEYPDCRKEPQVEEPEAPVEAKELVTPNGQATTDWAPRTASTTAVG